MDTVIAFCFAASVTHLPAAVPCSSYHVGWAQLPTSGIATCHAGLHHHSGLAHLSFHHGVGGAEEGANLVL